MAQIQQQRDIRLRELQIEFEAKKLAIEEDAARAREDAEIRYKQELEDNDRRFKRRLDQLKATLSEERQVLLEHVIEMLNIAAFAVEEFNKIWAQLITGFQLPGLQLPDTLPLPPPGTEPAELINPGGGFAEGGTVIARKPTLALFGERGAEAATFTPLGRVGRNEGRLFGDSSLGSARGESSMSLRVLLDPGLRAEIINQALVDMADVIIEEIRR